jgi:hypothetical protein
MFAYRGANTIDDYNFSHCRFSAEGMSHALNGLQNHMLRELTDKYN